MATRSRSGVARPSSAIGRAASSRRSACGEAAQSGWAGVGQLLRRPAGTRLVRGAGRARRAPRPAPARSIAMLSARRTAGSASGPSLRGEGEAEQAARPDRRRARLAGRLGGARERQVAERAADHQIGLRRSAKRATATRGRARRAAGCPARPRPASLVLAARRAAAGPPPSSLAGERDRGRCRDCRWMIASSGWASSCRKLGRGPRRLISSTSSVIAHDRLRSRRAPASAGCGWPG